MALPTTIVSDVGLAGHHPPYKSSAGNFYSVVRADADELDVYKATDPTDSWTVQGTGPVHAGTILGFASVQDGDTIHIIAWSSAAYEYYTFKMDTDAWDVDQAIEGSIDAAQMWGSIGVRSDGTIVVCYNGATDASMGDNKERVDINIGSNANPPVWGGPVSLDNGGDKHFGNTNVIIGPLTDDLHFVWQQTPAVEPDPPIAWNRAQGRTLDPSDTLSTADLIVSPDTSTSMLGIANAVSYDDGTQRMLWAGIEGESGKARKYIIATEDGSDDFLEGTGVTDTAGADGYINGEVGITTIAELSDDIHQLYAGGGTDGVDQDLYYTKSTDDGATWSTPTEEIDGITVNFISATIYVRDSDTVLAYVYDDGGVQKYNEKILIAGSGETATGAPSITAITSAGTTKQEQSATGAPSITAITSAGTTVQEQSATGAPEITNITAAGEAVIDEGETATGAPEITNITASGVSEIQKTSSGSPSILNVTAAGTATVFTPPIITDVDGDEAWDDGDTGLVITGSGFI